MSHDLTALKNAVGASSPIASEIVTAGPAARLAATFGIANPASKPGLDPTDARAGGRNFAERAADNVKDRIDGNPASKPGPDPTDRRA